MKKGSVFKRFEVHWVCLDPTIGAEMQKTRPCLIISPDEMNRNIATVIVAPITRGQQAYPTRVYCKCAGVEGYVALDQLRTVDKERLTNRAGVIEPEMQDEVLAVLAKMFAR